MSEGKQVFEKLNLGILFQIHLKLTQETNLVGLTDYDLCGLDR